MATMSTDFIYMVSVLHFATDRDPERRKEIYPVAKSYFDKKDEEISFEETKDLVDTFVNQLEEMDQELGLDSIPFFKGCMEEAESAKIMRTQIQDQYQAAADMVDTAFIAARDSVASEGGSFLPQSEPLNLGKEKAMAHMSKFFPWIDAEKNATFVDLPTCGHVNKLSPEPMVCFYDHPNKLFCVTCAAPVADESEEKGLCDVCTQPVPEDEWRTLNYTYGPIIFIGSFCQSCSDKEFPSAA